MTRFERIKACTHTEDMTRELNSNGRLFCPKGHSHKPECCDMPCGQCITNWLNEEHMDAGCPIARENILDAALMCVTGTRRQEYGEPEDNFGTIAKLWNVYINARNPHLNEDVIDAPAVAMMMVLLKVARSAAGRGDVDNYIDIAGYAACAGEVST